MYDYIHRIYLYAIYIFIECIIYIYMLHIYIYMYYIYTRVYIYISIIHILTLYLDLFGPHFW